MKKIIFAIILATASAGALTGCRDFLEADNKAGIDADPYFTTDKGQAALRTSMYNEVKPLVNNVDLTEWGTDLYTVTQTARANNFQTYKLTPEEQGVADYYTKAYSLINMANCLLKYGAANPKYVAEAKFLRCYGYYNLTQEFGAVPYVTEYISTGERNYPRTPLAEIYPKLIEELEAISSDPNLPETDMQGNVSRRAVRALLAKVCLAAGWDLNVQLDDAAKGLYSVKSTDYFRKAAQYADLAINGQPLTLSFEEKWSPTNEQNDEVIWAVQYERAGYPGDELTGGHGRQNTYGAQLGDPITSGMKACSGVLAPSAKSIYLWGKGDERYAATFMTVMYNYFPKDHPWPTSGYYAYYAASKESKSTLGITDVYFPWYTSLQEAEQYIREHKQQFVRGDAANNCRAHLISNPATLWEFNPDGTIKDVVTKDYASYIRQYVSSTLVVKKFDDPNTVQQNVSTNDYRDIVVFHLSDLYLTAAEAYLMAGDEAKALQYVNAVRARAKAPQLESFGSYVPDYEVSVGFGALRPIDVILDERAREVYAETTRWMDLRRTKQLVKYNIEFNSEINSIADMSNVRGDVKWYKPIPASEIATNSGITEDEQNSGY